MDLARSIQEVTEEAVLALAAHARERTGKRNLCLAGGVALNCVANGKLLRSGLFDDLWIQPAAGDAGGALGAALAVHYRDEGAQATGPAAGRLHARRPARAGVLARARSASTWTPRASPTRSCRRTRGRARSRR